MGAFTGRTNAARSRPRRLASVAVAAAAAVSVLVPAGTAHSASPPALRQGARRFMPARPLTPTRAQNRAVIDNKTRVVYHGGPVIQHVKIDLVVWDQWGYGEGVPLRGTRSVKSMLSGLVTSPYVAWLGQYNTQNPAQTINTGSFEGIYTIGVGAANNGPRITDAQVQNVLAKHISNGTLPPPDGNRLYVIYFPAGHNIVDGVGDSSLSNMCAYHGSMPYGAASAYYAAVPHYTRTGPCRAPSSLTNFDVVSDITAHEVAEAITDPDTARPAWFDPNSRYEIADICDGHAGFMKFADGQSYLVEYLWSNFDNTCTLLGSGARPFVTPPACSTPSNWNLLTAGQCLRPGQAISPPHYRFRFLLRQDGEVLLSGGMGLLWNLGIANWQTTELVMQNDGNLVAYSSDRVLWSSGTWGYPGARLVPQDDGNVVIYASNGTPVWSTGTAGACGFSEGDRIRTNECIGSTTGINSPNGNYTLTINSGDLRVYARSTGHLIWHTATTTGVVAKMQSNGNFVLRAGDNSLPWSTNTAGSAATQLVMQNDGNLVLFTASGAALWSSGTAGRT